MGGDGTQHVPVARPDGPRPGPVGSSPPDQGPVGSLLPTLARVHVLPLSVQAARALYPEHSTGDLPETKPPPLLIVHHFVKLLRSASAAQYPVRLFQPFYVDAHVYVIVDMEGVPPRCRGIEEGLLTVSTSIFTAGAPIEPLEFLHLSLIRPFTSSDALPSSATSSRSATANQPAASTAAAASDTHRRWILPASYHSSATSSAETSRTDVYAHQSPSPKTSSRAVAPVVPAEPLTGQVSGSLANSVALSPSSSTTSSVTDATPHDAVINPNTVSSPFGKTKRGVRTPQPTDGNVSLITSPSSSSTPLSSSTSPHPAQAFLSSCFTSTAGRDECGASGIIIGQENAPVMVELQSFLSTALQAVPSIVFIRGRELALSFSGTPSLVGSLYAACKQDARTGCRVSPSTPGSTSSVGIEAPLPGATTAAHPTLSFLRFFVTSTGDLPLGVAVPGITKVNVELDPVGEFTRIHICPIIDTIPVAYEFDFFNAYVRPFLDGAPGRLFYEGDVFTYHGVQFKVQRTRPARVTDIDIPDRNTIFWRPYNGILPREHHANRASLTVQLTPNATALLQQWELARQRFRHRCITRRSGALCCRIGQMTRIHQGEPTPLHWIDLLPPAVVDDIRVMPSRLQPFALMHAIGDLAPQDLLRILGWSAEQEPGDSRSEATVQQGMRDQLAMKIIEEFATTYAGKKQRSNCSSAPDETQKEPKDDPADHPADTQRKASGASSQDDDCGWTCVVCLESIAIEDRVLELPCTHVFHLKCVVEWLKRSILCPVCKRDLRDFL